MGEQRLKDKSIKPEDVIKALMAGSITIAQAQAMYSGVIPVGDYKGVAAILDLDLLVKQPLVLAEQQHILGILNGGTANRDLSTLSIALGEAVTAHVGQLTVPAGELWFINHVITIVPTNATANWHCSLWTDPAATPSSYGQPFHIANIAAGVTQWDEFNQVGNLWLANNKSVPLRAPAGTVFTFILNSVTSPAAVSGTFQIYGWLGKLLVD